MMNTTQVSETTHFNVYNASAGSGKTFTLVKEYLKIVLKSNDKFRFQHILAITFTNKAAAEMKVRVIDALRAFAKPVIDKENAALFQMISKELAIDDNLLRTRSELIIKEILNNYAAFNITTIDSFTYKLVRSFAFDLGLGLNFEVEMDAISLINEAVDVLISRIGDDKELTDTLIDFAIHKANEDKSWDISKDLKEISKLLLNEDDIAQLDKIKDKSIPEFLAFKKNIDTQIATSEKQFIAIGQKGIDSIAKTSLQFSDFASSDFPNHFKKLQQLNLATLSFEGRLAKNIDKDHHQSSGKASAAAKQDIDAIKAELTAIYFESKKIIEALYPSYLLHKLIAKSIIPLAVLRAINSSLTVIKEENNIRLNAEFNQLISTHLKEQPAAFIYERIGEKFQHYFIDEMQDTSTLQWENLIPLINNALTSESVKGEKGSLMLVGDAKQAIYRWRGGKAEQFIALADAKQPSPFHVDKKVNQLEINWRSYSQVIGFNNSFFQFMAKHLKNEDYLALYEVGNQQKENPKKGGYVEISFIEDGLSAADKDIVYPQKILEIITKLDKKFDKNEICILTRTRKHGVAIANYLTGEGIPIISSETLLLQNSPKVTFIIHLLTYVHQPNNDEMKFEFLYFLYHHFNITTDKHTFLTEFLAKEREVLFKELSEYNCNFNAHSFESMSLYDGVEYCIRAFRLTEESNAYLQFFLDVVLDYSHKKSEGISSFLNYWEEKKDRLSIVVPEGKKAVRIMTIHKAKGLEFPVVIYPYDLDIYKQLNPKVWYDDLDKAKYNDFETTLINYSKSLLNIGETGEALYHTQREALELDNFNLLYVALTRAEEQLYIISEHKKQADEPAFYAHFFRNFLEKETKWNDNQSVYSFGDNKRLSTPKKKDTISYEQKDFISSNWQEQNFTIVPSKIHQESTADARKYGNLIHEILAKVVTVNDISKAISYFIDVGQIPLEDEPIIRVLLEKVVAHPDLTMYFQKGVTVFNEREILTEDKSILIPDRLVFNANKVTVIDYKTGVFSKKHQHQINNYAAVLEKMNYKVVDKLLVYIDDVVRVERVF